MKVGEKADAANGDGRRERSVGTWTAARAGAALTIVSHDLLAVGVYDGRRLAVLVSGANTIGVMVVVVRCAGCGHRFGD